MKTFKDYIKNANFEIQHPRVHLGPKGGEFTEKGMKTMNTFHADHVLAKTEQVPVPEEKSNKYTIPDTAWGTFKEKIEKLNRKAKKLGCEPITFNVLEQKKVKFTHHFKKDGVEASKDYMVPARVIELHGKAPQIEGFQFLAKIEYLSDGKHVLFHTVPGNDIKVDDRFRNLTPDTCEHCNKIRRRNETFVVRDTTTRKANAGRLRQCLADFTGINHPEKIAAQALSWLESFDDLRDDERGYWGAHVADKLDTQEVLALTSAYISQLGWVPRSAVQFSGGASTSDMVKDHFDTMTRKDAKERSELDRMKGIADQPEHQERAKKVIDWVKNELAPKAKSDYEMNLSTLVDNDLIELKHLGIVASAVSAYQRAMNQKVEYAKKISDLKTS